MAEVEQEEVVLEEADNTTDEIDYNTAVLAIKRVKELEASLKKAEESVIKHKRMQKEPAVSTDPYTREDAVIDKLVSKHPNLEGYEQDLRQYVASGLSLDDAKLLVENKDKSIVNKQKLSASNVSNSAGLPSVAQAYSKADLIKLSQTDYNKAMDAIESGKAKLT